MTEEALNRANEIIAELESFGRYAKMEPAHIDVKLTKLRFYTVPFGSTIISASDKLKQRIVKVIAEHIAELKEELKQL